MCVIDPALEAMLQTQIARIRQIRTYRVLTVADAPAGAQAVPRPSGQRMIDEHGTDREYTRGCRCLDCRRAHKTARHKQWRDQRPGGLCRRCLRPA